jgi:hypothetical protein
VCTDGLYEFYFKVHGQKHSFQTQIDYERDAWVEALKTKLEEAKGMVESITKSDGYTENLEKLGKTNCSRLMFFFVWKSGLPRNMGFAHFLLQRDQAPRLCDESVSGAIAI